MKLSKVILTGVVGLVSLGLAACGGGGSSSGSTPATDGGSGEQIVFKLAFNQTDQHPQYKAGVEFGKRLEEATDGRYSIKVYPNEQLGTQSDVIQNLSNGFFFLSCHFISIIFYISGCLLKRNRERFPLTAFRNSANRKYNFRI